MIPRDARPVEHRSPYKRVDLCAQQPITPADAGSTELDATNAAVRRLEGKRIWDLIKQTAEGCNAPTNVPEVDPA